MFSVTAASYSTFTELLWLFFLPGQTSVLLGLGLQMWYLSPVLYTLTPTPITIFLPELQTTVMTWGSVVQYMPKIFLC